ncbi:MAG: family 78 glycoside hydrolase catalytic domain [Clostridia bacterium]
MFEITEILVEYRRNAMGLDVPIPRFSWKLNSDGRNVMQTAFRILVCCGEGTAWDSGRIESSRSINVEYEGADLEKTTIYNVEITSWDSHGNMAACETTFETGLMTYRNLKAGWITHDLPPGEEACPVFVRKFSLSGEVASARIYSTALGIYDLYLNGERVSDEYFSPGWTSYGKRLQYQAYDATKLLKAENELRATVANGWYKGNFAFEGRRNIYGDTAAFLMELHVIYSDGSKELIITDENWGFTTGEVIYSEIYHGETVDKNAVAAEPRPAKAYGHAVDMIIAAEAEPVRITKRLPAIEVINTPNNETVIDFGQNLTGFVEFKVKRKKGDIITIRHAEVLDKNGNFYTENLRAARATDTFICSGNEDFFRPRFTFHGFRYISVEGLGKNPDMSDFTACVLHTDMRQTGRFECSDDMVNKLQANIVWGQRGNFLDVPTDCPQRDERLGWTGDAQVFAATAAYNMNTALFFGKWLRDLSADQSDSGSVPYVIPDVITKKGEEARCSAAWGDAAVIVPWTMYWHYGDIRFLEMQYNSMTKWVDYLAAQDSGTYLWKSGTHFGDWLGLDMEQYFAQLKFSNESATGATDKHFIATAFFAYSTGIVAKTAGLLGRNQDERKYRELHERIIGAFRNEFATANGRLVSETQTGLILALLFNLVEDKHRKELIEKLEKNIKRHNDHMVAGFVGASYLSHVLSGNGLHELAGKLLLQKNYPSWLYPITKGATTIWERWNGIMPDGDFATPAMNSFNHYAYGAIGDWMYRKLLGINAAEPGYREITISPMPVEGIDYASGSLETMYGNVSCEWKAHGDDFEADVEIPVNCTAKFRFPGSGETVRVGSGKHHFSEKEQAAR